MKGNPDAGEESPGVCPVCGEVISDWSMADTEGVEWGFKPKHFACAYRHEPPGYPKYRAPVRPSPVRRKR